MINWIVIAFVLIGYGVSMLPSSRRGALIEDVRSFWSKSILVGFVFGLLAYISIPLATLHSKFTNGGRCKRRIELWIVGWVLVNLLILIYCIDRVPALILLPALRLADLLCVLLRVMNMKSQVYKTRTFLLLLLHYIEVTTIFACAYFVAQWFFGDELFSVNGSPSKITTMQAWYFSLVTGSTLGYGDITPLSTSSRVLLALQLLIVLVITLISIPRVFTVKDSSDGSTS